MHTEKSSINLWASFLAKHKLTIQRVDQFDLLLKLCEILATKGKPRVQPYKAELETRKLLCLTAMDNSIDLTQLTYKGRLAMSRGLLDMWNKTYAEKYGSSFGTVGDREVKRRNIKIQLGKKQVDM